MEEHNIKGGKKEKFDEWKKNYELKQKKERFDFLKPLSYTIIIVSIIIGGIYGLYSGEYKFIAQETVAINGVIYELGKSHLGKGMYVQRIKYSYSYENKDYQDSKVLFQKVGVKKKGDSLKLKISKSNPEKNIILGFSSQSQ